MNKKMMLFISTILLLLSSCITVNAEELPIDICVGGRWYQVTEMGDKVKWWEIDTENMSDDSNSMLGSSYFEMKEELKKTGLTISQIDNYLPTYEANRNFGGNSNFNQKNDKIDNFLNKYYSSYKNSTYYSALKSAKEESRYSFETTFLSKKCNRTSKADGSYEVFSCPTSNMQKKYNTNTFTSAVSKLEFDISTERFKTTIKDHFQIDINGVKETVDFGGKLKIRVLTGNYDNRANLDDYDYNSIVKSNDLVYTLNKGSSVALSFPKDTDIRLEFFINPNTTLSGGDANCVGAYLGFISFSTPGYAEVTNTKKDTSGACKTFRKFSKIDDEFKKALMPECYSETINYFTDYKNWNENEISARVNEIISEFNEIGLDNNPDLKNLNCHYDKQFGKWEIAESTKTYMYDPATGGEAKGYWAASCKETVRVEYDQPKQVIAGAGFSYGAKLTVSRTCTPVLLKNIVKKEKCKYKIECWGGPSNHHGEGGAGPNEDFDDCISACDGGEYSKNCINACYKAVYENTNADKTYSFMDVIKGASQLIAESSAPKLTKISYDFKEGDRTPLGNVVAGLAADKICNHTTQRCKGPKSGIEFVYDEGCDVNGHSTMCYEVLASSGNCVSDPEAEFQKDMNNAEAEYKELVKALKKYTQSEEVEMSVIDSYKTKNGKLLKTTWSDKVKKEVSTKTGDNAETSSGKNVTYGNRTVTVTKVKVSKSYTVNLPKAHVNVDKATVKYVKEGSPLASKYKDGGNKYYTDFKSGKYNDYSYGWNDGYSHNSAATINKKTGNNIGVVFKNIGTVRKSGASGNQYTWDKIDIDCFYGLYNQFNIVCEDKVCTTPDPTCKGPNCDPVDLTCKEGDVCTKGIQYMFRQVNLTDLFTDNRAPRWNWRHTTKVGTSYVSNASEIIEKIEKTGNDAYKHQPEYEFVITRGDITKIRQYNKTANNYQNYPDMTCSSVGKSGIKVCRSGFMSEYTHSFRRNTELGQNTTKNN